MLDDQTRRDLQDSIEDAARAKMAEEDMRSELVAMRRESATIIRFLDQWPETKAAHIAEIKKAFPKNGAAYRERALAGCHLAPEGQVASSVEK